MQTGTVLLGFFSPREPGRRLEQQPGVERAGREPQQERALEPQQQPRLPLRQDGGPPHQGVQSRERLRDDAGATIPQSTRKGRAP